MPTWSLEGCTVTVGLVTAKVEWISAWCVASWLAFTWAVVGGNVWDGISVEGNHVADDEEDAGSYHF